LLGGREASVVVPDWEVGKAGKGSNSSLETHEKKQFF